MPGVSIPKHLIERFPDEMTIVIQHRFWDLKVEDDAFSVGLSFGGVPEKLEIPFDAVNGFFDPSVQFGLQFEEVTEGQDRQAPANAQEKIAKKKRITTAPVTNAPAPVPPAPAAAKSPEPEPEPEKRGNGGGEVVRLDRFRKKK